VRKEKQIDYNTLRALRGFAVNIFWNREIVGIN